MPSQNDSIGSHPNAPDIFASWFSVTDYKPTRTFSHRSLTENAALDKDYIVEWLAKKLLNITTALLY